MRPVRRTSNEAHLRRSPGQRRRHAHRLQPCSPATTHRPASVLGRPPSGPPPSARSASPPPDAAHVEVATTASPATSPTEPRRRWPSVFTEPGPTAPRRPAASGSTAPICAAARARGNHGECVSGALKPASGSGVERHRQGHHPGRPVRGPGNLLRLTHPHHSSVPGSLRRGRWSGRHPQDPLTTNVSRPGIPLVVRASARLKTPLSSRTGYAHGSLTLTVAVALARGMRVG